MKQLFGTIQARLYNTDVDINERLGSFFINVGIITAIFGVILCLLCHTPASGTIAAALIAVGAPLIARITQHTGHRELYGGLIAVMIIFLIPIVWLTTGAFSGGSSFWLLYELFYITLFTNKKQIVPYVISALLVQAIAITVESLYPEEFFQFTDPADALMSRIGNVVIVTFDVLLTVFVQKALYVHEREINTKTQDMTRDFVTSIATTIDTKDPYTGGHSRRVAECARAIGLRLGMTEPDADNLYFVALLHDIGKIGIPDRVLNKPDQLTDEEFTMIRNHPVYGAKILETITTIPHVHDGVLYHHERYDGTGYPEGLTGEEIPFVARIIAVADSYDAMSTNRIYRKSIKREEIIQEMIQCRGTQFDPHIVDVFVAMLMEGYRTETFQRKDMGGIESDLALTVSEMMRHIIGEEPKAAQKSGTTLVNNAEFINLYNYLRHLSLRDGVEMVLVTISLDAKNEKLNEDRLQDCMVDLNRSITQNIRSVDICTYNSASSFLVLLLNSSPANVGHTIDRISRDFYRQQGNMDVTLTHNIVEYDALASRQD